MNASQSLAQPTPQKCMHEDTQRSTVLSTFQPPTSNLISSLNTISLAHARFGQTSKGATLRLQGVGASRAQKSGGNNSLRVFASNEGSATTTKNMSKGHFWGGQVQVIRRREAHAWGGNTGKVTGQTPG